MIILNYRYLELEKKLVIEGVRENSIIERLNLKKKVKNEFDFKNASNPIHFATFCKHKKISNDFL